VKNVIPPAILFCGLPSVPISVPAAAPCRILLW
jgi:hypothetical protein